jgi:hypothetical protein
MMTAMRTGQNNAQEGEKSITELERPFNGDRGTKTAVLEWIAVS